MYTDNAMEDQIIVLGELVDNEAPRLGVLQEFIDERLYLFESLWWAIFFTVVISVLYTGYREATKNK
jgi:hypothetical protein